jgi:ABC-type transport system involved in multi-copper enzyme maturation permease subunit
MMRGLLAKSWRETRLMTFVFAGFLFAFQVLLAFVTMRFFGDELEAWLESGFVRTMMNAMLGADVAEQFGPEALVSIAWVHPMTLYILFAHGMIAGTRLPVGEVERGTIDLLLGLPVRRAAAFGAEAVIGLSSAMVLCIASGLGHVAGHGLSGGEHLRMALNAGPVLVNLLAVYATVAALSCLFSTLTDRRWYALGIVFLVVEAWMLIAYVAPFWMPARYAAYGSIMHYYRPLEVIRDGHWPVWDILVLFVFAAVLWAIAARIFQRRDLCSI